jgi:hypothetical protein
VAAWTICRLVANPHIDKALTQSLTAVASARSLPDRDRILLPTKGLV